MCRYPSATAGDAAMTWPSRMTHAACMIAEQLPVTCTCSLRHKHTSWPWRGAVAEGTRPVLDSHLHEAVPCPEADRHRRGS